MGPRVLVLVPIVLAACGGGGSGGVEVGPAPAAGMAVTSAAFAEGDTIPVEFTCDGEDVSPPLQWSGVPDGAAELVLVVEDPDAPGGTFVHWLVVGIDPGATGIDRGGVPAGARQGTNDFGNAAYGGPCPPGGDEPHRYVFRVSALSEETGLSDGASVDDVSEAVRGTEIARGELVGRYGR